MKAVILVKARPGQAVISKKALQELARSAKGVKVDKILYCFGRFDGVILCNAQTHTGFAKFAEHVREKGNFVTETLIAVD